MAASSNYSVKRIREKASVLSILHALFLTTDAFAMELQLSPNKLGGIQAKKHIHVKVRLHFHHVTQESLHAPSSAEAPADISCLFSLADTHLYRELYLPQCQRFTFGFPNAAVILRQGAILLLFQKHFPEGWEGQVLTFSTTVGPSLIHSS